MFGVGYCTQIVHTAAKSVFLEIDNGTGCNDPIRLGEQ
jgi:hypothetical protein